MGSLASRPKVPQAQNVVVQQAASVPTNSISTTQPDSSSVDDSIDTKTQSEVRSNDLLRRSRGSLGTVLTSFRGLESTTSKSSQGRKTLLGE